MKNNPGRAEGVSDFGPIKYMLIILFAIKIKIFLTKKIKTAKYVYRCFCFLGEIHRMAGVAQLVRARGCGS